MSFELISGWRPTPDFGISSMCIWRSTFMGTCIVNVFF